MKKTFVFIVALVMTLTLVLPAFAEGIDAPIDTAGAPVSGSIRDYCEFPF